MDDREELRDPLHLVQDRRHSFGSATDDLRKPLGTGTQLPKRVGFQEVHEDRGREFLS